MPSLAAYPSIMSRDRKHEGLWVCRAAWLLGVTVRGYRELEAGERDPDADTWERMCEGVQLAYHSCDRWGMAARRHIGVGVPA